MRSIEETCAVSSALSIGLDKKVSAPIDRRKKYVETFGLGADDSRILSNERVISDYFEVLISFTDDPKKSCSYITTILFSMFEEQGTVVDFSTLKFDVRELGAVIGMTNADELSSTNAKEVLRELFTNGGIASEIVARK